MDYKVTKMPKIGRYWLWLTDTANNAPVKELGLHFDDYYIDTQSSFTAVKLIIVNGHQRECIALGVDPDEFINKMNALEHAA